MTKCKIHKKFFTNKETVCGAHIESRCSYYWDDVTCSQCLILRQDKSKEYNINKIEKFAVIETPVIKVEDIDMEKLKKFWSK